MRSSKYNSKSRWWWLKNHFELSAQPDYWRLTNRQHKMICNGVGSRVGFWSRLLYHIIPNTIFFLDITPASDIHDYDYCYPFHFDSLKSALLFKHAADCRFRENCFKIIDHETRWEWLKTMRRIRVEKYYFALSAYGLTAFLAGKSIGS